jgi:UDP-sugar pyrophosphorylase
MQNLSAQAPSAFSTNAAAGLFSEAQLQLASELVADGQSHLFSDWDKPGIHDEEKQRFMATLLNAHLAYPGGLTAYTRNARLLLAEAAAGANPFDGCTPAQPDLVDLSSFGSDYDAAEALGLRCFAESAVVLVAGGLGERLGYHGIKLDIPVEVTETTSYLAHYTSVIKAASKRLGREIPLIIMTSRDTDEGTRASLAANRNFGLEAGQITILRQELVPALSDMMPSLALEKKYELLLKPHGHGDIHTLLHTSGTAKKLAQSGVRYLLFIQDTNGQVFNAALAAIGVSEQRGYDFNSIAVNRIPGEAVGGIARLVKNDAPDLTINVEYNVLDPLLRATVSPEGDIPNENGFSKFPGNINLLIVRLAPYLKVLESSGGVVAEFVNPKFSDGTRTSFKKPARLETLMQDLPKNFTSGEKVGVTVFDRVWGFSACKNNLADAAQKVAQNGPPESASSAENDFYEAGRVKLRAAGMLVEDSPRQMLRGIPFTTGPRVILKPSFALTLADVREKIQGGRISGDTTLILEGDVRLENVTIPEGTSLVIHAKENTPSSLKDFTATSATHFVIQPLTDEEIQSETVPEYLRIRGYRIVRNAEIS